MIIFNEIFLRFSTFCRFVIAVVFFLLLFDNKLYACPLLQSSRDFTTNFSQKRKITGIKMPIISSGIFSVNVGKQVVWETLKPFYSKVVISRDGFKVQDENYSAGPLKELSAILLELHSGNLKALENIFDLKCEKLENNKYHLLANPKKNELKKLFKQIEIVGEKFPERINFIDARNDSTEVDFSDALK